MIKWPAKAAVAIRKLFEPLQEIDVYVEDQNDEVFYRSLINSACGGTVKVSRVFGLGGRKSVLEAAAAHDPSTRKALFIVDGDLEWVREVVAPKMPWLHQHEAYCVENLLLCEEALAKVISEEILVSTDDAKATMDYGGWRSSLIGPLAELFAAFGASHELAPHIQTVAMGVSPICIGGKKVKPAVDPAKVAIVKADIQSKVEAETSPTTYAAVYSRIFSRICALKDPMTSISGKDFLLPLLSFRLQGIGCRISRRTLRMRLVSAGDLQRFSGLRNALVDIAGS